MKKIFLISVLIMLTGTFSFGQDRGFGLGIRFGEPVGISAKYWLDEIVALDVNLGYTFLRSGSKFYLSADYLIHNENLIRAKERLPFYYGIGGRFVSHDMNDGSLGVKGVAGVAWLSRELPIDMFLEVAPVFNLFPSTELVFEAGLGFRYYFK
ncbi:MAG: hypothetical protein ACM3Q2_13685 [Syntrophothermus sp.]